MSEYGEYKLKNMFKNMLSEPKLTRDQEIIKEQQALIETLTEQRDLYKEIANAAIKKYGDKL